MNWKNEAIEKLSRYHAMCVSLENIPAELRRLEQQAAGLRGIPTDSPCVKGSPSRREDVLLGSLVHRQELEWGLEQAQLWVGSTQRALSVLDPESRQILDCLYIHPQSQGVRRLCQELNVESSTLYRKRDKALRAFTLALYGAEYS